MNKLCTSIIRRKPVFSPVKKQRGSSLIMAIFIILVISMLGISLMSLQRDSAESTTYEVYAARAYLAAYSASEIALMELFPLGEIDVEPDACISTNTIVTLPDDSDTVGFHGCSASYSCTIITSSDDSNTRYQIVSTATCQNNQINTRRQITVEATSL